jgi:2-keto-4-pentenoate hydratase/2-oxohepta-3-ene-1,7-dioic acid hydratase in catechol pathway
MNMTRRTVLQSTIAAGAAAMSGLAAGSATAAPHPTKNARVQPLPTGMTFATIRTAHGIGLGIRDGHRVLDVTAAEARFKTGAPTTMDDLIQGRGDVSALAGLMTKAKAAGAGQPLFIAENDAKFGPCVLAPEKIICVGLNYRSHIAEGGFEAPKVPILFNKFNSALNSHGGTIDVSSEKVAKHFDYEGELVLVIGKTARDVSEADALSYVFGYATGHDFSARDTQLETSQWMAGKAGDGWGPIGPWLVTADQIDPSNLDIETRVNGEVRQSSNTSRMIFDCKTLVSFTSKRMTLKPGDIIFTGTPEGVILGYPKEKQVWLKAGDTITTTIEKLGSQEVRLV